MTPQIINFVLILVIFGYLMTILFKLIKNKIRVNRFKTDKKYLNTKLYTQIIILFTAAIALEVLQLIFFILFITNDIKWIEWTSVGIQLASLFYFIVLLLIINKKINGAFVLVFENSFIFINNIIPIESIQVITNNLKRTLITFSYKEGDVVEIFSMKYHWKLKDLFKAECGEKYND
ncbi:hypothetical protein [Spiroplasma endosymbiont of Othius punctulatus]|uniref:hypothetical protein n=1 Tax=Spiroplasma endosymbiont of Othius punctulatus TaxID=3066289 RepID=UPI0030CF0C4A